MGKSNRLLMKMIKASGGWENFLYETLKEVCEEIDLTDAGKSLGDVVGDALDTIEAYEDYHGEEAVENHVPTEEFLTHISERKAKVNSIGSDKITKSVVEKIVPAVPKVVVKPRLIKAKIVIDEYVGGSQGMLPVPKGFQIVNKDKVVIKTVGGLEISRCDEDGQVRGQDVSGQITSKGDFRLVFKEVTLGTAFVDFEVLPIPPAPPAPELPKDYVPMNPEARAALRERNKVVFVDPSRNADGSNVKQMG